MPKLLNGKVPSHQCRKSGGGLVVLSGQYFYTGKYGTPEAEAEYHSQVASWIARGRQPEIRVKGITVKKVAEGYVKYATGRFVKRGKPTAHVATIRRVLNEVSKLYGNLAIGEFGPKRFHELRMFWINPPEGSKRSICSSTVHGYSNIICEMFRWAVGQELCPSEFYTRLAVMKPVNRHDGAWDYPPRLSAPAKSIDEGIKVLPEIPALIVQLMRVTAMRPAEACSINLKNLRKMDEPVWEYHVDPQWNKTEHHSRPRVVFIGPRAQTILKARMPRLKSDGYFFTPRQSARRGEPYCPRALVGIMGRYFKKHGIPHWSPNQLRHGGLTAINAAMGIEHAKSAAGHSSTKTTAVYIDPDVLNGPDREAARAAALAMG